MHKIADVEIAKNIMDANDRLAHKNLHLLEDHDIFCIDFVGAIGSGKTALIEDLIDNLGEKVGVLAPRPLLVSYLPYYNEEEKHRHDVRPGLTGLAQVNGRNNLTWEQKFSYDLEYVQNISVKMDLSVIFTTIGKVLKRSDVQTDTQYNEGNFAELRKAALAEKRSEPV